LPLPTLALAKEAVPLFKVTTSLVPPASSKPATTPEIVPLPVTVSEVVLSEEDRDSAKAVESELAAIKEFFAGRKRGARRFAEAVLGFEGELRAAFGITDCIGDALLEFFGSKPNPGDDNFTYYIRRSFREHVLDAGLLQQAIKESVSGYAAEAKRIEAEMLVGVGSDVDLSGAWPEIRSGERDSMIAEAREAAANDLVVEIGRQAVSWVLEDAIADQLTSKNDPLIKRGPIILGTGLAVDKAFDAGMAQFGCDPEGKLAVTIAASKNQ
jgi:hypothetical protein